MNESVQSQLDSSCKVILISVDQVEAGELNIIPSDRFDIDLRMDGSARAILKHYGNFRNAQE